jgi:drug/metabolite transporter (DMT)-like permease
METHWVLFAVLGGLASNCFNYLSRRLLRRGDDPAAFSWFFETLKFLVFGILAFYDSYIALRPSTLSLLLLLGLVELLSTYVFMKMHAFNELSISSIISKTRLVWIPMIAFVFLRESLRTLEYAGIFVVFMGLSIATSPRRLFIDKGVKLAYASGFMTAIVATLMKASSSLASVSLLGACSAFPTALLLPLLIKNGKQRTTTSIRDNIAIKIAATLTNIIAMYFYVFALREGPVSTVTAIYQGMMIVSIGGGIILLREREDVTKKIVGGLATLGGALLITWA